MRALHGASRLRIDRGVRDDLQQARIKTTTGRDAHTSTIAQVTAGQYLRIGRLLGRSGHGERARASTVPCQDANPETPSPFLHRAQDCSSGLVSQTHIASLPMPASSQGA